MKDMETEHTNPAQPEKEAGNNAEQLMKLLDLQLAQQRKERRGSGGDPRASFRVWSLVIIVAGTLLALGALQWMLMQLPRPEHNLQEQQQQQNASPAPATQIAR